jgi:hypothetical protein
VKPSGFGVEMNARRTSSFGADIWILFLECLLVSYCMTGLITC